MKAADFRVENIINFDPEEGKVFIKKARSLILNADALGTLRKDLIHNLGIDRAKGFLIRYGWQLGYNDGVILKENCLWDSEEECILAGANLFAFEGFARVLDEVIIFDHENRNLIKKGTFLNSFEADQHIQFFGKSDQPVCWLLIGYAGGYVSSVLGEKVYFIETKCKAKGDPVCEFEGRTLPQWGDLIDSELPFYEDITINQELDEAYQRIQEQNRKLERSLSIHQKLYHLVVHGEDMAGITKAVAQMFHGGIILFDRKLKVLASEINTDQGMIKELKNILTKNLSFGTMLDLSVVNHILPLTVHLSSDNNDYHCVILPIATGEELLGFIAGIHEISMEIEQESIVLLQRAASTYALNIIREKQIIDLKNQFISDFIDSLFHKKYSSIDFLIGWGERLGFDLRIPHYVLAMDIDYGDSGAISSEKRILLKKEVLETARKLLTTGCSSAMCLEFQEKILVIFPSSKKKEDLTCLLNKLISKLSYLKCVISIGCGSIAHEAEDYYPSYLQACKAIRIIKSFNKKERIVFLDDLGSLALLLDVSSDHDLLQFMHKKLEPILSYDLKNHSDLITTLEQYLNYSNINETSRRANLSLSGLKYRLNKIKDFGYNLNSPEEIFELQLAVKLYKLSSE